MRYDLVIQYAGQKRVFKNLELDDEIMVDESRVMGEMLNRESCVDNFLEHAEFKVVWKEG